MKAAVFKSFYTYIKEATKARILPARELGFRGLCFLAGVFILIEREVGDHV